MTNMRGCTGPGRLLNIEGGHMATTLEMLLAALNGDGRGLPAPAPSANIPLITQAGPPATPQYQFNPEPPLPPTAPSPAANPAFISSYAGQAPQAPAPLSRAQRIFNGIAGFGYGFQGQGPQFIEALERPQRIYERRREQFEDRRTRAIELDERRRDRQQELTQRRAEAQNDRDFQVWMKNTGVTDSLALEQLRQSHELEKEARRQRLETERELEREQRKREDDARSIAGRLGSGPGAAPPHVAKELGLYYSNIKQSLSPAAAKWVNAQVRRQELLSRPATGGGSAAASRREIQDLQRRQGQAAAGIAQMERLARAAMEADESKRPPILAQMSALRDTLQLQFGELLETGTHNNWPYVRFRLRGSQPQGGQQQQPQQDPLGVLR